MISGSDGINNHLELHGETNKRQSLRYKAEALPFHNLTARLRVTFIPGSFPNPCLEQQGISYSHVEVIWFCN